MSLFGFLPRILISKQVNTRTISLGKFLQIGKVNEDPVEDIKLNNVYDYDPGDRTEATDVDTSIRYIESKAFKETYGDNLVWQHYRRNSTGHHFKDTRVTCIRSNQIKTASPCPICRDKYLVPDYRNVKLLKHFISPHHGGLLPTKLTGVCQRQQKNLKLALLKAKEYGTISFDVPFRSYDYKYYQRLIKKHVDKECDKNHI